MEVPRLGVQSELKPVAYTTATAMQDPSHVYDLYHSSQQRWILNPLSKPGDCTRNLMVPSWIHFHCVLYYVYLLLCFFWFNLIFFLLIVFWVLSLYNGPFSPLFSFFLSFFLFIFYYSNEFITSVVV